MTALQTGGNGLSRIRKQIQRQAVHCEEWSQGHVPGLGATCPERVT